MSGRSCRWWIRPRWRRLPLLWLALVFGALVVALGRWRGARALVGLGASLGVVVGFVVPAILDSRSPAGVALAGSLAIMLVTFVVTHGLGPKMLAAALGTTIALLVTLGLGSLFIDLAHLTGFSSEEAIYLRSAVGTISIQGLLLAGLVIAALVVLDDLTVTQSSTVLALRRADPSLSFGRLFRAAIDVGHDHIAATVNGSCSPTPAPRSLCSSSSAWATPPSATPSTAKRLPKRLSPRSSVRSASSRPCL